MCCGMAVTFVSQGDSVNLAARLMQRATSEDGGVLCELATKRACGGLLQFKARGDFRIKVPSYITGRRFRSEKIQLLAVVFEDGVFFTDSNSL